MISLIHAQVTFAGSSNRSYFDITKSTRATSALETWVIKSLAQFVKVCSPPSNPGTSKNWYQADSGTPCIGNTFDYTYSVTACFDLPVLKSLPFGLPFTKVFKIDDFPLPANPITMMALGLLAAPSIASLIL